MRETIMEKRDALRILVKSGLPLEQADAVAQLVYDLNAESIDAVRDELRVWNARIGLWLLLLGFALMTGLIAAAPFVFL